MSSSLAELNAPRAEGGTHLFEDNTLLQLDGFTDSNLTVNMEADSDIFKFFLSDELAEQSSTSDLFNSSPLSFAESPALPLPGTEIGLNSTTSSAGNSPQSSPVHYPAEDLEQFNQILSGNPQLFDVNYEENPSVVIPIKIEPTSVNPRLISGSQTLPTPPVVASPAKDKKSNKKRDRTTAKVDVTTTITKEEVAKAATNKVETLTQVAAPGKQVNPDDEKQLKRQKRLIKNRESAQLSRLRKKIYIEELEKKVNQMTSDTEGLVKQVSTLQTENKKLKDEVVYLQGVIKQSPELSSALAKRNVQPVIVPSKNMKAAGVCLLVVLFSMGLLFNARDPSGNKFLRNREEIPEVMPKAKGLYAGRVLQSVEEDMRVLPIEEREVPIYKEVSSPIAPVESRKEVPSINKKHHRDEEYGSTIVIQHGKASVISSAPQQEKRKKMKIADETSDDSTKSGLVPVESVAKETTNDVVLRRDPAASYIYCPEAHHLAPATITSSGPEMIALLIPASVLNGTALANQPGFDTSLLEISCSVLNLHMWPLNATTATQRN